MTVFDLDHCLATDPAGLARLIDPGSFTSWDVPLPSHSTGDGSLERARQRTGADESVATGSATIANHAIAVISIDFAFLGGSIGVTASVRMVEAIRRATNEKLPLVISTASGGTRVTEGTRAFAMMMPIAAALTSHQRAGLPYFAFLRHPTMGGAFASWGSMAHLTLAEPGARIGFLGPKVHEAITGEQMPTGSQTAEQLYAARIVDRLTLVEDAREHIGALLHALQAPTKAERGALATQPQPQAHPEQRELSPGEIVDRSKDPERPTARDVLAYGWPGTVELSDRNDQVFLAIAPSAVGPLMVISQQRAGDRALRAIDLRTAQRGVDLAERLRLPILTIVDTPGAETSPRAEKDGIAHEISRTMGRLLTFDGPVASLILGQGTGGGAIAMLPADATIAAAHSWLAPLPLEGVSVLLHHDHTRVAEAAERQQLTPTELLAAGIISEIVPEHPDAAEEPAAFSQRCAAAVETTLAGLRQRHDHAAHRLTRYLDLCSVLSTSQVKEPHQ